MDESSTVLTNPIPEEWLKRPEPIEIDLGCHKGAFLVGMAELHRDRRWLGIEKKSTRVDRCLGRIGRLNLTNAWAIRGEGLSAANELLGEQSVAAIHVYFPDPWPKRRHWARRMVSTKFVRDAFSLLEPGGVLRLMTDDSSYAEAIRHAVASFGQFEEIPWNDERETVPTEFERKFTEIGTPVWRCALRRIG